MISINLDGYFKDPKNLPAKAGIYVVYACEAKGNTIQEARIIYIGQADNMQERHFKDGHYCHERLADFKKECKPNENPFYCYAEIDKSELDKVENALVAMQRPPLNDKLNKSYNHKADSFKIFGAGSIHFKFQNFSFLRDYDINSMFTEDEINFD